MSFSACKARMQDGAVVLLKIDVDAVVGKRTNTHAGPKQKDEISV
jgi:hypothetical protein